MGNREDEIVTRGDRERASNRLWRLIFWVVMIAVAMYVIATTEAKADSLRCNQDLVQPGDSYIDVTDACGEPEREVAITGEDDQRVGTALYYRGDYGQADRKVYMRAGNVTAIERLD